MGIGEILLLANVVVYFIIELSVIIKANKMEIPEGYPPKGWDWFQRGVENKWFWYELIIFLAIMCVIFWFCCK